MPGGNILARHVGINGESIDIAIVNTEISSVQGELENLVLNCSSVKIFYVLSNRFYSVDISASGLC
jgi:hypothetical protein